MSNRIKRMVLEWFINELRKLKERTFYSGLSHRVTNIGGTINSNENDILEILIKGLNLEKETQAPHVMRQQKKEYENSFTHPDSELRNPVKTSDDEFAVISKPPALDIKIVAFGEKQTKPQKWLWRKIAELHNDRVIDAVKNNFDVVEKMTLNEIVMGLTELRDNGINLTDEDRKELADGIDLKSISKKLTRSMVPGTAVEGIELLLSEILRLRKEECFKQKKNDNT